MSAERNAYDQYDTPDSVITDLFNMFPCIDPYLSGLTYLEPCYGSGKIYRHLPVGSQWTEIQDGKDYLTTQLEPVDCIITNPPFCLAKEFLEKSLMEADIVVYLVRLGFLASKKRKEFFKVNKPSTIAVLSKRPSFTGKGTDKYDCCWLIFDKHDRLNLDNFYVI